jgi:hypothetical protein
MGDLSNAKRKFSTLSRYVQSLLLYGDQVSYPHTVRSISARQITALCFRMRNLEWPLHLTRLVKRVVSCGQADWRQKYIAHSAYNRINYKPSRGDYCFWERLSGECFQHHTCYEFCCERLIGIAISGRQALYEHHPLGDWIQLTIAPRWQSLPD